MQFVLCVFPTRKPVPPDRVFLSYPVLIDPCLEQDLAHSRHSANICLVNEKGPPQCDHKRKQALPKRLKITEGVCDTSSRHLTFVFRLLTAFPCIVPVASSMVCVCLELTCLICKLLQSASLTNLWFPHVLFSLLYGVLPCEAATNYYPFSPALMHIWEFAVFQCSQQCFSGHLEHVSLQKG